MSLFGHLKLVVLFRFSQNWGIFVFLCAICADTRVCATVTLLRNYAKIKNFVLPKQRRETKATTMVGSGVLPPISRIDGAPDPGKGGFPGKHVMANMPMLSEFCFHLISDQERGFSRPSDVGSRRLGARPSGVATSRYVAS